VQAKVTRMARALREVLSPRLMNDLGRRVGQSARLRVVTPSRLIGALIGALGGGACRSIADILREFNLQHGTATRYKAFYNRLARPEFPEFVHCIMERALSALALRALAPAANSPLHMFEDILVQDGSSFALKDQLAGLFPGRFTHNGPAAVELHATFSSYRDEVLTVALAPDKEPEPPFLPDSAQLRGKLLLADRGYCSADYFNSVHLQGGHFIIRVTKSFDLWVVAQHRGRRRCVLRRPRRISQLIGKRYSGKPLDFEAKFDLRQTTTFRIVVLPGKESHGTRLATNLPIDQFGLLAVGRIYRLRWQIELIFKEWKSYANLRAFDTANPHIAEGLIWASLLVSIIKRFLAHAAQDVHCVAISTRRCAMCLQPWLRQLAGALERPRGNIGHVLTALLAYLALNAPRADLRRDARTGRLAPGLRVVGVG
jgi:Transposase DDE domain